MAPYEGARGHDADSFKVIEAASYVLMSAPVAVETQWNRATRARPPQAVKVERTMTRLIARKPVAVAPLRAILEQKARNGRAPGEEIRTASQKRAILEHEQLTP